MKYTAKSFTLPASGSRKDPCLHGWLDPRGKCVLCGEPVGLTETRISEQVHFPPFDVIPTP